MKTRLLEKTCQIFLHVPAYEEYVKNGTSNLPEIIEDGRKWKEVIERIKECPDDFEKKAEILKSVFPEFKNARLWYKKDLATIFEFFEYAEKSDWGKKLNDTLS